MIEQPDVWLCHRNYDKICKLSYIDDLKIYVTANAVDEVAFSLHKYNNGVEFEYWEQLKDLKIVLVDGFGYFEIAVDKLLVILHNVTCVRLLAELQTVLHLDT